MRILDTKTTKHVYVTAVLVLVFTLGLTGSLIARNEAGEIAAATVVNGSARPSLMDKDAPEATDSLVRADSMARNLSNTAANPSDTAGGTYEASKREKDAGPVGRSLGSGEASYYGREFAGRPTASGETFDPGALTAAHRTLPFGSKVRVTNSRNGRSVVVRINDRGPFVEHRLIDVSKGAAQRLGMIQSGTAHVRLELL